MRPKRIPVNAEMITQNISTYTLISMRASLGTLKLGISATTSLVMQAANSSPSRPPTSETRTLSVNNCRTSLPCPAPTASRIAISRVRRRPPCKLQVRNIRASDQQEQPHRSQKQPQTLPHFSTRDGDIEIVRQRRGEFVSRIAARIGLRELPMENMQSLFGDGGRGARRETHKREHSSLIAGIDPHGQPDTILSPPAETRGHDPDDGVRLIIQTKRLADSVRVASEEPLPTSEAEHGDQFRFTG